MPPSSSFSLLRLSLSLLSLSLSLDIITSTSHNHIFVQAHAADLYFPSIPEDPYAFPKYRVTFLNGFAVANTTAHTWLADGLKGGEAEFLGKKDWSSSAGSESSSATSVTSTIDGHETQAAGIEGDVIIPPETSQTTPYVDPTLELMRMGSKSSYLCLIPSPPSAPAPISTSSSPAEEQQKAVTRSPASSFELLQPMSGGCLYYTLGWFTYAYCHGKYVKQFREAAHAHPHPPGGRVPIEDPQWESFYLGIAPSPEASDSSSDVVSTESLVAANKLELARGAGQRYLIQRWDDGTMCDKTTSPRNIEIQFHCSMTTTDKILLIKETSVCSYVMVIHTPRLCGEPGFRSERDNHQESVLRCREVVSDEAFEAEQKAIEKQQQQLIDAHASFTTMTMTTTATGQREPRPPPVPEIPRYVEGLHPFKFAPGQRPTNQQRNQQRPAQVQGGQTQGAGAGTGTGAAGTKAASQSGAATSKKDRKKKDHTELLKQALKALLKKDDEDGEGDEGEDGFQIIDLTVDEDGNIVTSSAADFGDSAASADDSSPKRGTGGISAPDLQAIADNIDLSEGIVAIQGEDGEQMFLFVDALDALEELGAIDPAIAAAGGEGAPRRGANDGDGGRLEATRQKLLESLRGMEESINSRRTRIPKGEDEDDLPETHDEL